MKKPKGTDKTIFIPSNESEAHNGKAHYQRESNNNLYAQKITAYTPFLFPGDYYISIKRGEFPDDKAEEADGTPFSPFASFLETRFLDKEDLHLEPISASAGSGGEKTMDSLRGLVSRQLALTFAGRTGRLTARKTNASGHPPDLEPKALPNPQNLTACVSPKRPSSLSPALFKSSAEKDTHAVRFWGP